MKIDLSEVQAQKSALSTSVGSIKGDLTKARSSLSQVVSTNSLKGVVKDTINQKVSNYQIPLLDNYSNALDTAMMGLSSFLRRRLVRPMIVRLSIRSIWSESSRG